MGDRAFPCIKRGLNEVSEPENQQVTNLQGVMKIFPGFLSLEAKMMLVKNFLKKKRYLGLAIIELGEVSEGPIILVLCIFEILIIGSFQKVFKYFLFFISE